MVQPGRFAVEKVQIEVLLKSWVKFDGGSGELSSGVYYDSEEFQFIIGFVFSASNFSESLSNFTCPERSS